MNRCTLVYYIHDMLLYICIVCVYMTAVLCRTLVTNFVWVDYLHSISTYLTVCTTTIATSYYTYTPQLLSCSSTTRLYLVHHWSLSTATQTRLAQGMLEHLECLFTVLVCCAQCAVQMYRWQEYIESLLQTNNSTLTTSVHIHGMHVAFYVPEGHINDHQPTTQAGTTGTVDIQKHAFRHNSIIRSNAVHDMWYVQ